MQIETIILAIIGIIPTTATAISTVYLNSRRKKDKEESIKLAEKNASKASIQNMITQDIIRVEILGKLPENKDNIESEYGVYHSNGGNGTITRQVKEYMSWYDSKESNFSSKIICRDGICEVVDENGDKKISKK